MSFFNTLGDFVDTHGDAFAGAASVYGALDNAQDTKQMGGAIQEYLNTMGGNLNTGSQFQGYGVSTGLGTGGFVGYKPQLDANGNPMTDADGNAMMGPLTTDLGMSDPSLSAAGVNSTNAFTNSNAAMTNAMANPSARQGQIYEQMMAAQRPELNRMQSEQQAQEYARGRGGVRGSQYGGTAEDAAMARARVQGSADAQMGAMKQADAERSMFGQMAGQFGQMGNQQLQASFLPMQQQMAAMQLGQANADMAQTGQLTGLDYMAQLGLGGANANINAQHSANQLTGNLYNALLSNMGGATGEEGDSTSGLYGLGGLLSAAGTSLSNIPGLKWLSDARLKTNITKAEAVDGIQYYNWEWTQTAKDLGAENNPTYGVLAQDMLTQRPEAVSVGDHGYLMVDYSKI